MLNARNFRTKMWIFLVTAGTAIGSVAAFQNCSPYSLQTHELVSIKAENTATEGGNGVNYDGKIYVTDTICSDALRSPRGKILFAKTQKQASQLREDCVDLSPVKTIDVRDLQLTFNDTGEVTSLAFRGQKYYPEQSPPAVPQNGENSFTSPGTFQFTVPADIHFVSVVAVGAGGGGGNGICNTVPWGSGGGGGALAYGNNIPVSPGSVISISVGEGGTPGPCGGKGSKGKDSQFGNMVVAGGGDGGGSAPGTGGVPTGTNLQGGGNGGQGSVPSPDGSGGGAGGYSGNGGDGERDGSGGGGGGGGLDHVNCSGGGGGGVGLYGIGESGKAGVGRNQGGGGSGGQGGGSSFAGALFGGGGAGGCGGSKGASGAVRVIWGSNRSFPSLAN